MQTLQLVQTQAQTQALQLLAQTQALQLAQTQMLLQRFQTRRTLQLAQRRGCRRTNTMRCRQRLAPVRHETGESGRFNNNDKKGRLAAGGRRQPTASIIHGRRSVRV